MEIQIQKKAIYKKNKKQANKILRIIKQVKLKVKIPNIP